MSLKNFRTPEKPAPAEQPKVYEWDHRAETALPTGWLQEGEDESSLKRTVCTPANLYDWAKYFATSTGTEPNEIAGMSYEDLVGLAGDGAYGQGNWVVLRDDTPSQPVLGWQGKPEQSQQLLNVVYRPQAEQS